MAAPDSVAGGSLKMALTLVNSGDDTIAGVAPSTSIHSLLSRLRDTNLPPSRAAVAVLFRLQPAVGRASRVGLVEKHPANCQRVPLARRQRPGRLLALRLVAIPWQLALLAKVSKISKTTVASCGSTCRVPVAGSYL